ncbi:MAG: metal-sulfur cluster assembly factor [Candidatus Ancillula sp.]|jgi:metal-sulfur cluster biosynthetic enzyme|nr:metal-sulfur cluster assembly factor [Candidatus Ancillula sp.]
MSNDSLIAEIKEALKVVLDPELGISIVDLGLVYGVDINDFGGVAINVTLTTPACPLTDTIEEQIKQAVSHIVSEVDVNWVWNPPWSTDMITEDGRAQLSAIGFNF